MSTEMVAGKVCEMFMCVGIEVDGFAWKWNFEDWEPDHYHWRGPSWFGFKTDGTIEFGAAYLANMQRTDPIFDVGTPRTFAVNWAMFDSAGNKILYGGHAIAVGLHYKDVARNRVQQWKYGQAYADKIKQSTRCTVQRVIVRQIVEPGPTIPGIDIPWDPK
ncbi:hypothetical protein [Pseudomonas sp. BF-R-30]|uniref:hypothetical protein n=1 Tax=Pseudomonas sp. BF-R-30 TaxID=2832384 RepID=UPI001CC0068E|nr:hypothetical protein [Pseudomonas sp. BF-R-30]